MAQPLEFLAIGDIVTDAFIRLSKAHVTDSMDHQSKELCMTFGDKIPYESVTVVKGVGNSANAAVSAARLGLSAGLISDVGDDHNGKEMIGVIAERGVSTDFIRLHEGLSSNYHYVLWYGEERTILVKHEHYPNKFPHLVEAPRWMYLSSLGENSLPYHMEIAEYLETHPETKLAFQPGTFQISLGIDVLLPIYKRSNIFFCNVEEAQRILKVEDHVSVLLEKMHALGPNIVAISDGIKGAYAYDGKAKWFMPIYPQDPYERTGAGDAFASTVTVALSLGMTLEEALSWGPINSMSVVQKIGAQEGLLTREELLEYLKNAPADYKPVKID